MTELIREQLVLFGMSLYTGLVIATVYDFIRIFRNVSESGTIIVWIQDLIYWVCCGYIVYCLFLKYNYGGIRMYALAGMTLGMALYFLTISRVFVKYTTLFIKKIIKTLLKALNFVWKPIKILFKWSHTIIKKKVIKWRDTKKKRAIKKEETKKKRMRQRQREQAPEGKEEN